jgi:hypothetical protein
VSFVFGVASLVCSCAMASGSELSDETLFGQMLAYQLQKEVAKSQMSGYGYVDSDDMFVFEPQSTTVRVMSRLDSLETVVHSLQEKIDLLLARFFAEPRLSPEQIALMSPARATAGSNSTSSPSSPSIRGGGIRKKPRSHPSSSDGSDPTSPNVLGFQFVCPLCLKPQYTPKSHCEHVKHTVSEGVHNCRFILEHSKHSHIIRRFGSASNFVRWYCSHLRSGVGSQYTEADVQAYEQLQQRLIGELSGGEFPASAQ